MNSNDLMYYLKGFVDLTNEPPSRDQWGIIRAKVKEASPVETFVVDAPPMHNPIHDPRPFTFIDRSKLPPLPPSPRRVAIVVAAVQHLRDNPELKAVEVCRRCNLNILGGQLLPSHFFVYTSSNIR